MKHNVEESEQKRLESLRRKKQEYQMQKNTLKSAFSKMDTKQKKIIFNDDDEVDENVAKSNTNESNKLDLFDNEDEEDEGTYNFEVKDHFEGEKGKKLWELQNKTRKDKRFEMDARFLDDDEENNAQKDTNKIYDEEISIQKEKELELKIMDKVLGKSVSMEKPQVKKTAPKNMRYDPSNPDHQMYEIKEIEKKPKKEKKKKTTEVLEELPEVSKDQYYQVTTDFKQTLQEKESFSLLNMFGRTEPVDDEEEDKSERNEKPEKRKRSSDEDRPEELKKSKLENGKNPFKYDSSDDENEKEKSTSPKESKNENVVIFPKKSNSRPWHEPFFFTKDDYRFQEGRDFLQKAKSRSQEEFLQLRGTLKKIIRAKVKNITKKQKMFKKKLGGSKKKIFRKKKPHGTK